MECPLCYNNYDEEKYLPKVLPICGHPICQACVD